MLEVHTGQQENLVSSGKFKTWPGKTMLPSCKAGDSFKQEVGCLWRSLAASISAIPFSCHPSHAAHCFFLILSFFVPRKGQVDETLPVALIHEHRRKLAPFRDHH